MLVFWLSIALGATPTGVPAYFDVGSGEVSGLSASPDGAYLVGHTAGDHSAFVLDTLDWSVEVLSPCTVSSAAFVETDTYGQELYVGCDSGEVMVYDWEDGDLGAALDSEGTAVSYIMADYGDLERLWWDSTYELLYGLVMDGNLGDLHVIDPASSAQDSAVFYDYPWYLSHTGFKEGVMTESMLILAHGSQDMTQVYLTTGNGVVNTSTSSAGVVMSVADLTPSNLGAYCIDSNGTLGNYLTSSMSYQIFLQGLSSPTSIASSLETGDEWLLVTGNSEMNVWELSGGGLTDPNPVSTVALESNFSDVVASHGYAYGGDSSGRVWVATANPWVSDVIVDQAAASIGDTVQLNFSVDQPGTYSVFRGGDLENSGALLGDGEMQVEGMVALSIDIDEAWAEGENQIFVIHTNNLLLKGHGVTSLAVDSIPTEVELAEANVQFLDGGLEVSFDGIPDLDLDYYEIYITTESFAKSDWSTGGPEFDIGGNVSSPITHSANGGDSVTLEISPLVNGTPYYVAVRAFDQGGLEGPMSNVVSGIPRSTMGAAQLAGETGGAPCNTGPTRSMGWITMIGLIIAVFRRGRHWKMLAPVLIFLLVPQVGLAKKGKKNLMKVDETPAWGNFEARYGVITLTDERISDVYNENSHNIFQLEFGTQIYRFLEFDLGVGFAQELAWTVDASGNPSGQRTMLTWIPLSADVVLRLHILDEQPLVPYARVGSDYVLWNEQWDAGGADKEILSGAKVGWHFGFGINLLLDMLAPARASQLEAQTGINDTYLTVEWRRQWIDSRKWVWEAPEGDGLLFSGDMITVGLKLDY